MLLVTNDKPWISLSLTNFACIADFGLPEDAFKDFPLDLDPKRST